MTQDKMNELITYSVTDAAIAKLRNEYLPLRVQGLEDVEGYEVCRKARIEVKRLRCDVEARRKELKAESLEFGRKVDAKAKEITSQLTEIEDHLRAEQDVIDKEKERIRLEVEAKAKAKLQARIDALSACGATFDVERLKEISDAEFTERLAVVQQNYQEKLLREEQERQRLAELEKEREEQARKIAEQEAEAKRLRDELIAKQKAELAAKEAELARVRAEEKKARAKAEAEERARKEEALAAERKRQEEEADRRRQEEAAAAERLKREKAAAKRIADAKAFEAIKKEFPTLESAWVEIARLRKLLDAS